MNNIFYYVRLHFSMILVLFFALGIISSAAFAWEISGDVAVCTAACEQKFPTIVSDGSGGAIITWRDYRGTTGHIVQGIDIYAQRVNANGAPQWTINGIAICTAGNDQDYPTLVSDSSGGAIITWEDHRVNGGIYAQRINSSGVSQWTTNGVAVCTAAGGQWAPTIISDGNGGAIITWDNGLYDIYVQRLNSSGVSQWTTDGVAICTAASAQEFPTITSDDNGGAIIAWQDTRSSNYDIYAQRINSSGVTQWTTNGVAICTTAGDQQSPMLVSNSSGGAIITWQDRRNGNNDIYAQSINSSGIPQWTANGVAVCTTASDQDSPQIVSDGSSGAIITWDNGGGGIYAQRVNSSGVSQWTTNGVAVCTTAGGQYYPTLVSDNSGGAIIAWDDERSGISHIYAQKINSSGISQWTMNGVAVCTAANGQSLPTPVSDGSNGAIIAWIDSRNYSYSGIDIYAQSITAAGFVPIELSRFRTEYSLYPPQE